MKWLSDEKLERLRAIAGDPDFSSTKYDLVRELARGGMGTVYLAEDVELHRQIAIKVLNTPEVHPDSAARMMSEAQIIARLEHPGIVPLHDVGVLPDGRVFYAMRLVRGYRLDEYAAEVHSLKDRLRKLQAACDAVAFAHAHGVVHRDLKPQNIMIGAFGEVLVLDWGVAKVLRENPTVFSEANTLILPRQKSARRETHGDDETLHGTIIGTPHYMSPEQSRGEVRQVDARSDVYSLGALLYFLITDRAPVFKLSQQSHLLNGQPEVITRPRELNARIGKAVEAICLKAMSSIPGERYGSAAELSADVGRFLDGERVSAYRENGMERISRWASKNRFFVLLVLAYLLMRIFFILAARL